jgi:hypothetical protein
MTETKLTRRVCHVRIIYAALDAKLKRLAECQPVNTTAAAQAFQKLLNARRARLAHADRCPICRLPAERKVLSADEVSWLGEDIGNLFEKEAMRLARIECAHRHAMEEAA